ncbi:MULTISPECIES: tail fiber protein [Zoogloea]|jgi:microcystin-dependent protein|uniref:Phage tail protein n=1 Tax=Zoogloea oleivorans TaxID=1552750 RepID=A0A6C2D6K0_9RHOO|nr:MULTISPECIES: tail fiber protein [Zoogloea]MBT9498233.1 phage tail protein [Zoogloea sp.]MDD2670205.1 tail fiber protein [Zoogloea sp.]MDY0037447.1 tail fiber protein [Zoogloea oleivorans]TYC61671.1 phage tail protein [Zoogloea oleivorans]
MADPFLGEIRVFTGNFAPSGWALCQGQLMPIAENDALFSLIGTTYGGDGQNTFALPNLAGSIPIHQGAGPGLTPRSMGEAGGSEHVTLNTQQLPIHTHTAICANAGADRASPVGSFWATDPGGNSGGYSTTAGSQMAGTAIGPSGGGQPHDNLQPFLVINYIIALEGIFPPQS